jgi:hypothetical protein
VCGFAEDALAGVGGDAGRKNDGIAATVDYCRTREFWQIFIPFSVYVGFFNSVSSLLNQILSPHAGVGGDAGRKNDGIAATVDY